MIGTTDSDPPTLAVVVPTLNEAPHLAALVRSLRAGAAPDRVVVVDGGSDDQTREIARELGVELRCAPQGRGTQMAAGARGATEDLLLFLHADMQVEPGAVAAVRRAFQDPALVAVGMQQRIDGEGFFYRLVERAADRRVRAGAVFGDSGLGVRRRVYEDVGGFADVPLFEDLDLCRRLRRRGVIGLAPGAGLVVSARRWRREGPWRATLRNWGLRTAWRLGVAPERLARFYPPEVASGAPR